MLTNIQVVVCGNIVLSQEEDAKDLEALLAFVNGLVNGPLAETGFDITMESLNLVIEVRHLDDFPFDEGGLTMVTSKVDGIAVQTVTHPNFFGPVKLETLV
jgi:hypothetical protein